MVNPGGRVAEPFAHDLDGHACLQEKRRVRVAKVVETPRDRRAHHDLVEEL